MMFPTVLPRSSPTASKYSLHLVITAARRMISGRVPTMISSFSLPSSLNLMSE